MTRRRTTLVALLVALVLPVAAAISQGSAGAQTPTTAPTTTTAPPSTPTTAVDTGTVPVAQDGTGKALLIGAAFIGIILVGVAVARVLPERAHAEPTAPSVADEQPRPLLFDQDRTDGSGWPTATGPSSPRPAGPRPHRPQPTRPAHREHG